MVQRNGDIQATGQAGKEVSSEVGSCLHIHEDSTFEVMGGLDIWGLELSKLYSLPTLLTLLSYFLGEDFQVILNTNPE